jgi:hypothetical protein
MEYNDGQAIIMTPQGNFERIKTKKPLEVGEYYYGNSATMQKRYAMIAVLLLALTLGTWDFFAVQAYAQVSSSLELGVNRWNRVVMVRPLDAKGATILRESNLTGQIFSFLPEQHQTGLAFLISQLINSSVFYGLSQIHHKRPPVSGILIQHIKNYIGYYGSLFISGIYIFATCLGYHPQAKLHQIIINLIQSMFFPGLKSLHTLIHEIIYGVFAWIDHYGPPGKYLADM